MRVLLLTLLSAALGGCSGFPPPEVLDDEYTECEVAEDCVPVAFNCCPCAGESVVRHVNVQSVEEVLDRFGDDCEEVDCPDVECDQGPPVMSVCDVGTCSALP